MTQAENADSKSYFIRKEATMKGQVVKVVLNPQRADEQRIVEYLLSCGKSKSKILKTAMLSYIDREAQLSEENRLLRKVREIIREELSSIKIYGSNDTAPKEDEGSEIFWRIWDAYDHLS